MKLINPTFHILEQNPGINGVFEMITRAGYTCYKTEKEITPESAFNFVERMKNSHHCAMLEHGTVYLTIPLDNRGDQNKGFLDFIKYLRNPYSKTNIFKAEGVNIAYITTNYRVLYENHWLDDLRYISDKPTSHIRRYTVRLVTDRGVSHEIVRHRVMSFAQESTRYCNYSKDKFGNELTFIKPSWYDDAEECIKSNFDASLVYAEDYYLSLLDHQYTPQQARQVLPNALKTEIVVTGFISDWEHLFDLRVKGTTGAPHPDMKALMEPVWEEFWNRGYLKR